MHKSVYKSVLGIMVLLLLLASGSWAYAILTIEITEGGDTGLPIAVVPFAWEGQGRPPHDVSAIISSDLARSGRIAPIPVKQFIVKQVSEPVNFKDWRLIKAEALVFGRVRQSAVGKYVVEFQLYDVFKQTRLAGYSFVADDSILRMTAHQISDIIYEKLTGQPGAFSSRIVYITKQNRQQTATYKLQIADSDGYGPVTLVTSKEPMLSPAWAPDGKSLAYVSFEQRRSMIYIQRLRDGKRRKVAEFRGINSAPAWSPDGKRLALTLSRDGNAEIYIMDMASGRLTRLTRNYAIDTEPAWSPDSKHIVFTSDRAGRPQIYRMRVDGSDVRRLTYEGSYNARASYAPDGKSLVLVSGTGSRFHIASLELRNQSLRVLTDTPLDESPSFSPNGAMIIYATEMRNHGVLASVSADGRVRQIYRFDQGDVREPAWSPVNHQTRMKE